MVLSTDLHELLLTYISLLYRWSLIIGLGVVALFMAVSWMFAPKGETQTYVEPFSVIAGHLEKNGKIRETWKDDGKINRGWLNGATTPARRSRVEERYLGAIDAHEPGVARGSSAVAWQSMINELKQSKETDGRRVLQMLVVRSFAGHPGLTWQFTVSGDPLCYYPQHAAISCGVSELLLLHVISRD